MNKDLKNALAELALFLAGACVGAIIVLSTGMRLANGPDNRKVAQPSHARSAAERDLESTIWTNGVVCGACVVETWLDARDGTSVPSANDGGLFRQAALIPGSAVQMGVINK